MDAYQVYLKALTYVMNADPQDPNSWSEIFKYLPYLHQILLCSVCGKLLNKPQGPVDTICLHYVCLSCVGGSMRLKPSCSWCKDHGCFIENKKLRILVLCFKRLCAYISHSPLGCHIFKAVVMNGSVENPEIIRQIIKDAEEFTDDFSFIVSYEEFPKIMKLSHSNNYLSLPSTSSGVLCKNLYKSQFINESSIKGKKEGKRINFPISPVKSNASIRVKRLKRKVLTATARNHITTIKRFQLPLKAGRFEARKSHPSSAASNLLISQRPHRNLSGKFSVGQLWRETFLEENLPPEPDVLYPDSGIEVGGNISDQDHSMLPPVLQSQREFKRLSIKAAKQETIDKPHFIRGTRLNPALLDEETHPSSIADIGTSGESVSYDNPTLSMKISKVRLKNDVSSQSMNELGNKIENCREHGKFVKKVAGSSKNVKLKNKHICRCVRFKQPNQLTCFGQKCPCYREHKACVDCLCHGCKNPRHKSNSVPSLLHVMNESESACNKNKHGIEPSMPRLSPIPI